MSEPGNHRYWNPDYSPWDSRVELPTPPPKPSFTEEVRYINKGNHHTLHAQVHPKDAAYTVHRDGFHHASGNASNGQVLSSIKQHGKYTVTIFDGANRAQSTITL